MISPAIHPSALAEGLGVTPEGRRFLEFFADGGQRRRVCRPDRVETGEGGV